MSKFEEKLLKKMDAEKDQKAVAERSFRKATNIVTQQISALKTKRVDLEIEAEEKQEALENATFTENFSVGKYDAAKSAVEEVQEQLADIDETIKAREELLESWK